MLPIVDGCTHGRCHFCSIFDGIPFTALPMDDVIADIDVIAKGATALTRRIYLTGGNPFSLSVQKLIEVFDAVEERIPTVDSYGGFCCIRDIKGKSDEELALLASRGVSHITIGAESGFDEALEFMEKGHTAADVVEQGKRLHAAGIPFTFFYLVGMAGAGRGQENALATAQAFSEAAPERVLVVCMTPSSEWPLAADIEAGLWVPPTEVEMAEEIRTFVANLTSRTFVNSSHDTDIIRFEGLVPVNQQEMVELMDHQIPKINEAAARRMREALHGATF